jgi:hypothetical protein
MFPIAMLLISLFMLQCCVLQMLPMQMLPIANVAYWNFTHCNVSYDLFEEELVNVEVSLAQVSGSLPVVHRTLEVRKITIGGIIISKHLELLVTIKITTVKLRKQWFISTNQTALFSLQSSEWKKGDEVVWSNNVLSKFIFFFRILFFQIFFF